MIVIAGHVDGDGNIISHQGPSADFSVYRPNWGTLILQFKPKFIGRPIVVANVVAYYYGNFSAVVGYRDEKPQQVEVLTTEDGKSCRAGIYFIAVGNGA